MKQKTEPMSELHERLRRYREEAKRYTKQEIQAFRITIAKREYPKKCLQCFEGGLRFCRFWLDGFTCESWEREKELEAFAEKIETLL